MGAPARQAPGLMPGMPDIDLAVRTLPLLGWDGLGIVEARAWSTRRLVVCVLDPAEHRRRQAEGMFPAADPFLLRSLAAQDPRFVLAPPPVRIVGAIAVRRTWKAAIANLAGFAAFGALAAVVPAGAADRLDVAAEAPVHGIGVIAADAAGTVRLVHRAGVHTAAARTWVHRLIEEIVYDALLTPASAPDPASGATAPPSSAGSRALPTRSADRA